MTGDNLARIERVSLQEAWPHEAHNFTPWLADNLDDLGDALDIPLQLQERESPVGTKKLDILATDPTGNPVVIENQLYPTDDNHLGRLLIYAAGKDAKSVIWVASAIDDEHRQVLDWLNQRTDDNTHFYGVAVELWKIDNSRAAPHFKVVVAPNERQESICTPPPPPPDSVQKNISFRKLFVDTLKQSHGVERVVTRENTAGPWCVIQYPVPGTKLTVGWSGGTIAFGLEITQKVAPHVFQNLGKRRADIESKIPDLARGDESQWGITEAGGKIAVSRPGNIYANQALWGEYCDWIVDKFVKFRAELAAAAGE